MTRTVGAWRSAPAAAVQDRRHDLPWASVRSYQVDERVAADGDPVLEVAGAANVHGQTGAGATGDAP
jgi:hypothetical protein